MKIKRGFVLQQVGGAYLAVATGKLTAEFNGMVRMNSTGAFLWNKITERDMSSEELVDALLGEYDVTRDIAARDVQAFEDKLRVNGILE